MGIILALAAQGAILATLVPFRTHLSTATAALAFVIPVVVGVVVGGFVPGALASVVGFVLYDVFFLPPYGTLTVHDEENWLALVVYLVVTLLVAQVVTNLNAARDEARRREQDAGRLFELSQALIGDFTISELLDHIATTVQTVFAPRWTALLLPVESTLAADRPELFVAARDGQAISPEEIDVAHLERRGDPVAGHGRRRSGQSHRRGPGGEQPTSRPPGAARGPIRTAGPGPARDLRQPGCAWPSNGRSSRTRPCARVSSRR